MTNRRDWFVFFVQNNPKPDIVTFGDGRKHLVEGCGNLTVKLSDGHTFQNARYIPNMKKYLLSINETMEHIPHLEILFKNNKCLVKKKRSNKVITSGIKEHGLYRFVKVDVAKSHALVACVET
jgi:hypothetical protein